MRHEDMSLAAAENIPPLSPGFNWIWTVLIVDVKEENKILVSVCQRWRGTSGFARSP